MKDHKLGLILQEITKDQQALLAIRGRLQIRLEYLEGCRKTNMTNAITTLGECLSSLEFVQRSVFK